jgi:hypothetical protein
MMRIRSKRATANDSEADAAWRVAGTLECSRCAWRKERRDAFRMDSPFLLPPERLGKFLLARSHEGTFRATGRSATEVLQLRASQMGEGTWVQQWARVQQAAALAPKTMRRTAEEKASCSFFRRSASASSSSLGRTRGRFAPPGGRRPRCRTRHGGWRARLSVPAALGGRRGETLFAWTVLRGGEREARNLRDERKTCKYNSMRLMSEYHNNRPSSI